MHMYICGIKFEFLFIYFKVLFNYSTLLSTYNGSIDHVH